MVVLWYAGNTFYNIYNKTALNMMHANWCIASAQLFVGVGISVVLWATGIRKLPNLTASDWIACIPIGFFASMAHCGTVLASAVGAVSFAQIVKACEPVFAAVVGLMVPPMDLKPMLAYLMLIPIVGGVGIACIKEGKGVEINYEAFLYASLANAAAALKGKLGSSVTKSLESNASKNMDAANVYAVMNIISFAFTIPFVVFTESSTLQRTWDDAVAVHGSTEILKNIVISGAFFLFYNETAFAFTRYGRDNSWLSLLLFAGLCLTFCLPWHQPCRSRHIQCTEHSQASYHHSCIGYCLSRGYGAQHCSWVSYRHWRNIRLLSDLIGKTSTESEAGLIA